jgi:hypothetical protein
VRALVVCRTIRGAAHTQSAEEALRLEPHVLRGALSFHAASREPMRGWNVATARRARDHEPSDGVRSCRDCVLGRHADTFCAVWNESHVQPFRLGTLGTSGPGRPDDVAAATSEIAAPGYRIHVVRYSGWQRPICPKPPRSSETPRYEPRSVLALISPRKRSRHFRTPSRDLLDVDVAVGNSLP